ncbi:Lrp/AsnC family transcriptional regulator, partial [Enterococcus faecalis]|uniref:Lrp/AsnC family transcriptional regulator n=1 Tax=Enterococcus faecalis TaxID=1351 RepID=UPI003D6A9E04
MSPRETTGGAGPRKLPICPGRHVMTTTVLDRIDIKILNELQQNANLTNVELASRVNLSPSPCLARVKTLEKLGVIDRRIAVL